MLVFGGWLHPDLAVQARVVEPVDVRQGGPFDVVGAAPGPFVMDELGLVETVEAFSEREGTPLVGPVVMRVGVGCSSAR